MAKAASSIGWGLVVSDSNTDGAAGRGGAIAFGARRTDGGMFNAGAVAGAKSNSTGTNENGDLVLYSSVASSLTERMRIRSNGEVTTPNTPRAHIAKTTSQSLTTSSSTMTFNSVAYNVGSCYSTRGNRFTAPVEGYYLAYFSLNVLATTSYTILQIAKNGTMYQNVDHFTSAANIRFNHTAFGIIHCSASDYISVIGYVGSGSLSVDNAGHFTVALLG